MNAVKAAVRRRWRDEMEWGRDHPIKFCLLMFAAWCAPDVIRISLERRRLRRLMAECPEDCCSQQVDTTEEPR